MYGSVTVALRRASETGLEIGVGAAAPGSEVRVRGCGAELGLICTPESWRVLSLGSEGLGGYIVGKYSASGVFGGRSVYCERDGERSGAAERAALCTVACFGAVALCIALWWSRSHRSFRQTFSCVDGGLLSFL